MKPSTPPTGGGTGPRNRSRYAPDKEARRAAELALKLGVKLKLGADGSVEVLGRLDSPPPAGLASGPEGDAGAESYEDWKRSHPPGRG